MNLKISYYHDQLLSVLSNKKDQTFKIKIVGDNEETKWLNINIDQFREISHIVINKG